MPICPRLEEAASENQGCRQVPSQLWAIELMTSHHGRGTHPPPAFAKPGRFSPFAPYQMATSPARWLPSAQKRAVGRTERLPGELENRYYFTSVRVLWGCGLMPETWQ